MLKRAVLSSLAQKNVSLRVSVFDNASGDETSSVVGELMRCDQRLHYFCHRTNIGGAANFDFGMRAVDTPFFSVLSDDDYLLPGFYERALRGLARHPEAMFWAGMTLLVDESNWIWDVPVSRWGSEGLFPPPSGLLSMMHGKAPTWTGIVFRREVLDCLGFPDQEVLGPSDLDFVLRAAATFPFVLEKVPVSVFTLNAESFSATQPLSMFWPGWQKMFINISGISGLDERTKAEALNALHYDARHMLFSRGMHAMAYGRIEFARDAANVLSLQGDGKLRSWVMNCLLLFCRKVALIRTIYGSLYRGMETRMVRSRRKLQEQFAHLLHKGA